MLGRREQEKHGRRRNGMGRVPEGLFESDGTWWKEEGPGNVGGLGIGLKEVRKTRG